MKNVVVYHDPCLDGFTSYWLLAKELGSNVIGVPSNYGDKQAATVEELIERSKGEWVLSNFVHLWVVDFSFSGDQLQRLSKYFTKITVLDHHESAVKRLDHYLRNNRMPANVEVILNMDRSGAGLVAEYLHKDGQSPIVKFVEDGDLWRFAYPQTRYIRELLKHQEMTLANWSHLNNRMLNELDAVVKEGKVAYDDLQAELNALCSDNNLRHVTFCNEVAVMVDCPYKLASAVGERIYTRFPGHVAIMYDSSGDSRLYSLRSDGSVNVAALAMRYGGGGHPKAAGFKLSDDFSENDVFGID